MSRTKRDRIFISGVISVLLAIVVSCESHVTPSTYLIPRNFRGKFTIFYDEPCGVRIPKIGGRLIYHIPANGIMIVSNHLETGIVDDRLFFADMGSGLTELPQKSKADFPPSTALPPDDPSLTVVSAIMDGVFSRERGDMNSNHPNRSHGVEWYVLSWDSIGAFTGKGLHGPETQHENLADSLLDLCRAKK
jgi:hypothetical protein